jgi:hypothetical protein
MKATEENGQVIVSAQISVEQRDELERRALAADRSLSAEIRRGLREYLERDDDGGEVA